MCGAPSTSMSWRVARRLYWCSECYDKHAEEREAYSAQQHSTQKGRWDWWDWKRGRKVQIQRTDDLVETSESIPLPVIVADTCPICGGVTTIDLRKSTFPRPQINGTVALVLSCKGYDDASAHEESIWTRKFTLRLQLESVREKG